MFNVSTKRDLRGLDGLFIVAFLAAATPQTALLAQGLEDPQAVETIIGSDVKVEESGAQAEADAVIAAIENTTESIAEVRKRFTLDNVEIVFLPDIENSASPVGRKVEQYQDQISELHQAIEGNPMFFHAADSRSLPINDVVALAFDDANGVKIYAAGEAPEQ